MLGLVVAVAFVFSGCASSFEREFGLKEEGMGSISDIKTEKKDGCRTDYLITIRYCGQETTTLVTWKTYDKLWLEKAVYLKLLPETYRDGKNASGDRSREVTYIWWATDGSFDKALSGQFKLP